MRLCVAARSDTMKLNMQPSHFIARSDSVTEAGDVIPAVWVESVPHI